jgi:hypothetical protein
MEATVNGVRHAPVNAMTAVYDVWVDDTAPSARLHVTLTEEGIIMDLYDEKDEEVLDSCAYMAQDAVHMLIIDRPEEG